MRPKWTFSQIFLHYIGDDNTFATMDVFFIKQERFRLATHRQPNDIYSSVLFPVDTIVICRT